MGIGHVVLMSRCGIALSVAWGMAMPLASPACAQPAAGRPVASDAHASAALHDFDIPAQPLGEALQAYTALTLQPTLARTELIAGRTATAVRGRYSDRVGLDRLLQATGLSAERIPGTPGFVLREAQEPSDSVVAMPLGDLDGYPALLQSRVWRALCGDPRIAPGDYRLLLRLGVDASGRLRQVELIGGTGSPARDATLLAALQSLRLDHGPPPSLRQPLLLAVEPHSVSGGPLCAEAP